ncbi:hypothetical protein EYZ11_012729 [Aspergillus tanneri]|uniref:Uncharacterized protein n=1 Tax=Aspergillus tanneri TaxID=1220188 RepID=A0A4S3IZH4_9EURO|nr:hypothetical protein EYZ11_012729 [Aspergillus tanneri]
MRIAIESIETQWELATKNRFLRKMQSANPRRSKRLKLKEQKWRDKVDEISHFALLVENITKTAPKVGNPNPIPRTYEEAINDPVYGPEWKKAIRSEFWSLLINGSFRETHAPDGVNSVTAKWVFAVGYAPNRIRELSDLKRERLVARGLSQVQGVEYKTNLRANNPH